MFSGYSLSLGILPTPIETIMSGKSILKQLSVVDQSDHKNNVLLIKAYKKSNSLKNPKY